MKRFTSKIRRGPPGPPPAPPRPSEIEAILEGKTVVQHSVSESQSKAILDGVKKTLSPPPPPPILHGQTPPPPLELFTTHRTVGKTAALYQTHKAVVTEGMMPPIVDIVPNTAEHEALLEIWRKYFVGREIVTEHKG